MSWSAGWEYEELSSGCDPVDQNNKDQKTDVTSQLQAENENLKNQLSRALEMTKELESLHLKNRSLNTQLLEANQKATNFQNRLQMSQKKLQEIEEKSQALETENRKILNERDNITAQALDLEKKNSSLSAELNSLHRQIKEVSNELSETYDVIEKHTDVTVTSPSDVNDAIIALKNAKKQEKMAEKQAQKDSELEKADKKNKKLKSMLTSMKKTFDDELAKEKKDSDDKIQNLETLTQEAACEIQELKRQISELTEQNECTNERNRELQVRLDQLKADREEDITRYKQSMEAKEQRILELKTTLANPLRSDVDQNQTLVKDLSVKKRECDELREELEETHEALKNAQLELGALTAKCEEMKHNKKQMKKHYVSFVDAQEQLKEEVEKMNKDREIMRKQIEDYKAANESIQAQLKAAAASHAEGQTAWNAKVQELNEAKTAMNSMEVMAQRQRDEISKLTEERKRMSDLLQKQNQIALALENEAAEQTKKNGEISQKLKNAEKLNRQLTDIKVRVDSGEYLMGFLKARVIELIPEQERFRLIQLAHNTALPMAERIDEITNTVVDLCQIACARADISPDELANLEDEKEREQRRSIHLESILWGVLNGFQNLANEDKSLADYDGSNENLAEFLASQCVEIDRTLKESDTAKNELTPTDFIFRGGVGERKQAIEQVAAAGWDNSATFDLFCAQSLSNIAQAQEMKHMREIIEHQDDQLKKVKKTLGCQNMEDTHDCLRAFAKRMKQLEAKNRQLIELKKGLKQLESEGRSVPELENTISELHEQIANLEENLKTVVSDATTLQRELDVKTQQVISLEKCHNDLATDSSANQKKHLDEVCQFEKIIDERNREVRDLTLKLTQHMSDAEQKIDSLTKQNGELKEKFKAKSEELKQVTTLLRQKKRNSEQQLLNKLRAKERQSQDETKKMTDDYNDMKAKMSDTIASLQKQGSEQRELAEKLTESLEKSEKRNQQLTNELSKVVIAKKGLEVQLKSLTDQMQREAQIMSSQAALRTMNQETKHQEDLSALKCRLLKEKCDLMTNLLVDFDEIDKFDGDDIEEETFLGIMKQIACDYRRQRNSQHM